MLPESTSTERRIQLQNLQRTCFCTANSKFLPLISDDCIIGGKEGKSCVSSPRSCEMHESTKCLNPSNSHSLIEMFASPNVSHSCGRSTHSDNNSFCIPKKCIVQFLHQRVHVGNSFPLGILVSDLAAWNESVQSGVPFTTATRSGQM